MYDCKELWEIAIILSPPFFFFIFFNQTSQTKIQCLLQRAKGDNMNPETSDLLPFGFC